MSEVGVEAAVETLVSRGYKVGMIEQMETAQEAKAARGASAVIRRELVSIASAATHGALVPAHPKAAAGAQAVGEEAADAPRGVADVRGGLLCVHERTPVGANAAVQASSFGLAFLDADRGRVVLGLASDEGMSRANLSAVLTRLRPREVLLMAGATHATRRLLAAPPVPLQVSWLGDETPRCGTGLLRRSTGTHCAAQHRLLLIMTFTSSPALAACQTSPACSPPSPPRSWARRHSPPRCCRRTRGRRPPCADCWPTCSACAVPVN